MPTIIEERPISITIGPVQMVGYLFVASPQEETIVDGQIEVPGLIQETIRMVITQQMAVVDITVHLEQYTFSLTFDLPSSSILCKLEPKNSETEGEWHVLTTLAV